MLSRSSAGPYTPDIPMQPSAIGNTAGPVAPSGVLRLGSIIVRSFFAASNGTESGATDEARPRAAYHVGVRAFERPAEMLPPTPPSTHSVDRFRFASNIQPWS